MLIREVLKQGGGTATAGPGTRSRSHPVSGRRLSGVHQGSGRRHGYCVTVAFSVRAASPVTSDDDKGVKPRMASCRGNEAKGTFVIEFCDMTFVL